MTKTTQPFKDLVARLGELEPKSWIRNQLGRIGDQPATVIYSTEYEGLLTQLSKTVKDPARGELPELSTCQLRIYTPLEDFSADIGGDDVDGLYSIVNKKVSEHLKTSVQ